MWLSCGGGGVAGANNASAAMVILPNPKMFKRGIVFKGNALDHTVNEAVTAPMGAAFAWYDQEGRQSYITGEVLQQQLKSNTYPIYHEFTRYRADSVSETQALDIIQRTNYSAFYGLSIPVSCRNSASYTAHSFRRLSGSFFIRYYRIGRCRGRTPSIS